LSSSLGYYIGCRTSRAGSEADRPRPAPAVPREGSTWSTTSDSLLLEAWGRGESRHQSSSLPRPMLPSTRAPAEDGRKGV